MKTLIAVAALALTLGCESKKISVEECRRVCDPYAVSRLSAGYAADCQCNNAVLMDYPERTK